MKIKIHITVASDAGVTGVIQEVAVLEGGALRPETLGLSLAETRSILAGIAQTMVDQQVQEFLVPQQVCPLCNRRRSRKGGHRMVFRTPFWIIRKCREGK